MKKDTFVCVVVAAFSLTVAAVFHRFYPGFGMVFKPLLWPLVVLPFVVRARFACGTAFVVPLLSCAVNGMPSLPVAICLSAFSAVALQVIAVCRRFALRRMKACGLLAVLWALSGVCGERAFEPGSFLVGVNYWSSQDGIRMWQEDRWKPAEIEKDLAALATYGVEAVRVFPTWPDFQPIRKIRRYRGVWDGMVDMKDRPLTNVYGMDDKAIERFRFFCDAAARHNIKVMPSLITGWMSGRLFVPEALENLDPITSPEALVWEGRFARYFVRKLKDHPAIVSWGLGNECACMGKADVTKEEAWVWVNTISSAIRMEDPSRPVLSGEHGMKTLSSANWNLAMQGELLDVLTPHPYPSPMRIEASAGPLNSFRNALHGVGHCLFYQGFTGKPAFPQEIGSFGPNIAPDRIAALAMRQQLFANWMHGMTGYLWWCAFEQMNLDYHPFTANAMERELGFLKPDDVRSPKPQADAMKAFQAFRRSLPFDRLPPRRVDAVALLGERAYKDFGQTSLGCTLLSKLAGIDVAFVRAETGVLPLAKLYIVLAGEEWGTYTRRVELAVRRAVEAGATVLVNRGGTTGYSDWFDFAGQEVQLFRRQRTVSFELDGAKMSVPDSFTTEVTPVSCEVVARDQTGNPAITKKRLGKGRVIALNFELELNALLAQQGVVDFPIANPTWRVYDYAAREAGIVRRVTRTDCGVVLTEHPREDGSLLVVALNTHPEQVVCPIDVKGEVGRVWNGKYADGKLSIGGNDGCVFEVK